MPKEIDQLIASLETAFDQQPWFGDAVIEKINSLSEEDIHVVLPGGSHSIAELILHMINWKKLVVEKVNGNADFKIAINSSDDWSPAEIVRNYNLKQLINKLLSVQEELIQVLSKKSDKFLDTQVAGGNYTYRYMIEGVIQHDIYHLGQIGLIKRMIENSKQ